MGLGVDVQAALPGVYGVYAGHNAECRRNDFDHGGLGEGMLVAGNVRVEVGRVEGCIFFICSLVRGLIGSLGEDCLGCYEEKEKREKK